MSKYITNKMETIVNAGTSFGTAIESKEVKLDNYQSAKVIITSSTGDEAKTKARVVAVIDESNTETIKEVEVTIGANKENAIEIVANELARYDALSFKVEIDAVDKSSVTGSVIVILSEARYSE